MIRTVLCAMLLTAAMPAAAQQPTPTVTYATSAEVQAAIARAKAAIKPGQPVFVQPLLSFAPYTVQLEYRQGAAGGAIHKSEAELFQVVQGAGTLMLGGTVVDGKDDPRNVMGTATTGGTARRVVAGDVFVIPEGTPHWFNAVEGNLVMVVVKVPRENAR